jgi:cation transporter-like permease
MSDSGIQVHNSERPWLFFNAAAALLALLCVASLAAVLLIKVAGGVPWTGLDWIAMIGLPLAFILMGVGVLHAISRRRRI